MDRLPFDKPGTFRKGNIHTHSTASDGTLPPEEVCRRYHEAGYDFLAITYHFLEQFDYPYLWIRSLLQICPILDMVAPSRHSCNLPDRNNPMID